MTLIFLTKVPVCGTIRFIFLVYLLCVARIASSDISLLIIEGVRAPRSGTNLREHVRPRVLKDPFLDESRNCNENTKRHRHRKKRRLLKEISLQKILRFIYSIFHYQFPKGAFLNFHIYFPRGLVVEMRIIHFRIYFLIHDGVKLKKLEIK